MKIRLLPTATIASIVLACCSQSISAQESAETEDSIFSAEQDRDPGPPPRREARPPRDRGPGGDRAPDRDRGPEPRRPDDGQPPRGPQGGFGGRGGGGGFGGGGFGPAGPQFAPPHAPMAGPPRGDGGLDERIARLEHKLDAVLHELHALRSEQQHPGPMGQRGSGGYGSVAWTPHPPMGPPPRWQDQRFEEHRMPGPPHRTEGPQPRRVGPPNGPPNGPPRGPRAGGGPPREWDSPPPPRGERRGRDRDDDDDDDDRPRGAERELRDLDRSF